MQRPIDQALITTFSTLQKGSVLVFYFLLFSTVTFATGNSANEKTYIKTYYAGGNIKAEGWMLNSKKTGYWKFYYRNGQLEKEGHLSKDKPAKYWYFYSVKGLLVSEGHYENGRKTDWWSYYDSQENIIHKCQLQRGKKNGYCLIYSKNKIVKASKFKGGKKINEWKDLKSFRKDNKLSDLE